MPDWTGNTNSVYATLGASNHTDAERHQDDYYATDPRAVDALLAKATLSPTLWECACGAGHLSKRLIELGYDVKSSDLVDRGYGTPGVDFLKCEDRFDGDIITNPPFKYAQQFVEHALALVPDGRRVFMFLRLQFLEGKSRRQLFDTGALRTVYVFSSRVPTYKGGKVEGTPQSVIAYAWFEFEKGYKGKTTIEWIN